MGPILVLAVLAIGQSWWRRHRSGARQRRLMLLCEHADLEFTPMDLRLDTAWLPFPDVRRPEAWDRQHGLGPASG